MSILFRKTKKLEIKMDEFLDITSETAMTFYEGVGHYLSGQPNDFSFALKKIKKLENRADVLRRSIESHLYTETLIPESRGDVLALLENTDEVNNQVKETMLDLSIELPLIPEKFQTEFLNLVKQSERAMDEMVNAMRSFLKNPMAVRNYLHKVYHFEKEADKVAAELKQKIFSDPELDLSQKSHIRFFIRDVDAVADKAEDVADRLTIYTIKRSV